MCSSDLFVQPGNYSYYLEKRTDRERRETPSPAAVIAPPAPPTTESAPAPKPARPRKLSFKEQRELEGIEGAILAAETRADEIETTLHDPAFYSTRAKEAPALAAELDAARSEVARLYERWAELDSIGK